MTRTFATLAALLGLVAGVPAFAASPNFNDVAPKGGQRGTEVVLTLTGANLADAQEVLLDAPGLTVVKLEVVNAATVKLTVAVAPTCRLGEHGLRLRTATGISELRTFWVGALPVVAEVEPNTLFDQAQPIPLNVTVHGVIDGEDADYFVVECKKGQRLSVEVEGMRLGVAFWDPFVAILDARRFELAFNDDSPLIGQDAGCSVVIPADGKYTILVRESSYGGSGACRYRLHVGNFPRPTAVLPAGGEPGEEVEFRFLGDPAGEIRQKIKLPAAADDHFRLHCVTPEGTNPTGFKVRVGDLPSTVETGTNVTLALATPGVAPGAFHGVVSKPGESKFFKFPAKKGQTFEAHCYARRLGSPLDSVMVVARADTGQPLASNDDVVGPDSSFRFAAPEDGIYILYVHDHLQKGGPDYFFCVEVKAVVPFTSTGIPKVDGNNVSNQDRQTLAVPRGGRVATLVNVNRADWGGPAGVAFEKLPAGVTVVADPTDPGQAVVPVVLEAKADAPLAGVLTGLTALPTDGKTVAPSRLALDVCYNMGVNNNPFHRYVTDKAAVAVTEVAPFTVEAVEPKAPVPQNGSLNVKIVVKRAPTFKGPITLTPLFTPPGMGITGSTVIAETATEASVYMNAAPNAVARKWKTAFTANAATPTGVVWTSTQLFTVEIAAPFVTFAQERSAVDQGGATKVFGKVVVARPFDGKATVKLIGLPAKAATPDQELTKESKELSFAVTTDKATPPGKHGVFVQVVVPVNGEFLVHNVGGNEFRVDVPLPPKVAPVVAAVAPAKPVAPVPAAAPPTAKPLTRLEQLRKEQDDREKAGKPSTPAAPAAPAPAPAAPAPKLPEKKG
jgi:hypothetical protein